MVTIVQQVSEMLSKAISASAARSQVAIVGRSSKHCLLARSALASYGPRPSFLHVLLFFQTHALERWGIQVLYEILSCLRWHKIAKGLVNQNHCHSKNVSSMHFEFCVLFPSLMRLKANLMENVRRCKYVQNFSEGHSLFHLNMIHYSEPAWHLAYIFCTVCGHLIFAILLIFCHFFFETFLLMMY